MSCPSTPERTKYPRAASLSAAASDLAKSSAKEKLQEILKNPRAKIIVFSGAGISVSAGLDTFSGQIYDKAAEKFNLSDGMKVFFYSFLQQRPRDCFSFLKQLYLKVRKASPTPTHEVFKQFADQGKLIRHYTMNIDGLSEEAGMSVWNHTEQVGTTVEMHGNIKKLVCRSCGNVSKMTSRTEPVPTCARCGGEVRFCVMMYNDEEHRLVRNFTPLTRILPNDLANADAIVWVGISFKQSVSGMYFFDVQEEMSRIGKQLPMFVVDPRPDDALERLEDTLVVLGSSLDGIFGIESTSDDLFAPFKDSRQ